MIKNFYYSQNHSEESNPTLLIPIPIFTFVLGNILIGAGFLATFTSGLMINTIGKMKKISRFYVSST